MVRRAIRQGLQTSATHNATLYLRVCKAQTQGYAKGSYPGPFAAAALSHSHEELPYLLSFEIRDICTSMGLDTELRQREPVSYAQ